MRILLTGGTDVYGHSLVFLFLREGTASESAPTAVCDRAFFHAQLRPCIDVLMTNAYCPGISVVADFRDITSADQLNAILSSLIICHNELGSNLAICYFVEPSSRQLRRALCRFVKCGKEEANTTSSAFKIPFQVLLFSGVKGLKDHIKNALLPEELGGTLVFDEVSYLLQIAVFDTLGKLKTSIAAMHFFIESAASGDVLDGDVSTCLEQFFQLREQAFGLYSHLKNAGFDKFDPFPIFRKLFAEGDALHALAMQIRAALMERQHRLNAFSTLCSKLGEGERFLSLLDSVLTTPDAYPNLLNGPSYGNDESTLQIDKFFSVESGSPIMTQFIGDVRYLLETAFLLNEDSLGGQLRSAFDLDAISKQVDRVESLYPTSFERIISKVFPPIKEEALSKMQTPAISKPDIESLELEERYISSNSPCPLSSSSMSHTQNSESAATSSGNDNNKVSMSFSAISPVGLQSPTEVPEIELDNASCKSANSVSIQTEIFEPKKMDNPPSSQTIVAEVIKAEATHIYNKITMPPNYYAASIAELDQLVDRFEARVAELRQTAKVNGSHSNNRQILAEMKDLLGKLTTAARKMHLNSSIGSQQSQ